MKSRELVKHRKTLSYSEDFLPSHFSLVEKQLAQLKLQQTLSILMLAQNFLV